MQNLTKYSNRHYFIPRKIVNSSFNLNGNLKLSRLPVLRQYHVLHRMYKKYGVGQSVLQDYLFYQRYLLKSENCRNFSTSSKRNEKQDNNNKPPQDDDPVKHIILGLIKLTAAISFMIYIIRTNIDPIMANIGDGEGSVSWQEFVYEMLAKGEVQRIDVYPSAKVAKVHLYPGAIIKGQQIQHPTSYILQIPDIEHIEEKLKKVERSLGIQKGDEVQVVFNRSFEMLQYFPFFIMAVLLLILMRLSSAHINMKHFVGRFNSAQFTLVDPLTKHGKDYLKQPERYKTLGAKIPRGALLLGPPGCGKTLLAKAVATEANVPFLSMNGSEFIEVLGGLGAARVRDLFKEGKKRAPSIIYIDEIDAIGRKRAESMIEDTGGEIERTLNQLLVEMDGMTSRDDIIILASTNRAEVLDKALLRPGRFDRHILIDLPTLEERRQIFEYHLKKIALQEKPSKYSGYLAYLTPGFTGADIANVCNEAALHAARYKKKIVEGSDLMYAIDRTIGGTKKINSTVTPSMKRVIAYHEAGHALVGWLLKHTDALLKVTIVPRTNLSLGFSQYTESDHKLQSKEELQDKMCMMLAGRAAENLVFNQITTGAQNDLEKVTKLAYLQVQQYGMCPTMGLLAFDEELTSTRTKKPYSKKLGNLMDAEARRLIAKAYENAQEIITENKDKLERLAEALLKKETLTYDDVEKLIGPPLYGKKRLIEPAEFESSVPTIELPTANSATT
ncbi:hypothetical protein KPH14_002450 [Odynerus spinipes]|uniref:AAA+ ATPase domain-containing protein n=1 Tax=Odynerus spinipes TaxID=1348599 RepID=A0AAD9RFP8_9HYME|nr:hypothetical protein KPH14_002450 [Odynerus spinipes]